MCNDLTIFCRSGELSHDWAKELYYHVTPFFLYSRTIVILYLMMLPFYTFDPGDFFYIALFSITSIYGDTTLMTLYVLVSNT